MADAPDPIRHRPALHQHDPDAVDGRDPEGELRPSRARRWRWRRSPTRSGSAACASTRPTRSGRTATASCSRPATPRCCSTRCSTSPGCGRSTPTTRSRGRPRSASTTSSASASSTRRRPGHPEYRWTSGVETTTGPLGQGIATSVGMAIASEWQAAHFNRPDFELFDFDVYAIAGDGCLMEGVSHEAASIAGHQRLDNLCWFYDNNHITIDGHTDLTYEDDVATRFEGYGWNVTRIEDANDLEQIDRAIENFRDRDRAPDPDRRRQPHRLRRAAQAGHRRGPRRAARRRGGARDQALLRLARGRGVPRPRGRSRALRRGHRQARRRAQRRVEAAVRGLPREGARAGRRGGADAAPRAARRLGRGHPRASSPTRRAWPPARPRTRSRTRSPSAFPGWWRARPT